MSLWRLLPLLLPLTACAGGERGCAVTLANASSEPIEQVYVAPPTTGASDGGASGAGPQGPDLLAPAELAPGEARAIRLPGGGGLALRAVWASGRAAEMQGVEACRLDRITVRDGAVQAE